MTEYFIVPISQKEAMPFVLDHMHALGTIWDREWTDISVDFVKWFGAKDGTSIKGVLGIMTCSSMPDDLIIVGIYGQPKAVKMLGDFVLQHPQKNKFGYIDVQNESWMLALMKRGFEVSPIVEIDKVGNKIRMVQLTGDNNAR